ncbi:MAG: hypothetical protein GYB64_12975 [Chloroflexi bacterium]|nr:hypothetical protein [Chloroflexota bacterium]
MTFSIIWIPFFLMAAFTIGGGLGVVISRNLIHAALFLALSLFGMAGLFVLLEATFIAGAQVLVYLGAIAVLITITIMVTRRLMGITETVNRQWPIAALISLLVFITLTVVNVNAFGAVLEPVAPVPADDITLLGLLLADAEGYFVPFEVASVLLLAALIGSIVVAREARE